MATAFISTAAPSTIATAGSAPIPFVRNWMFSTITPCDFTVRADWPSPLMKTGALGSPTSLTGRVNVRLV